MILYIACPFFAVDSCVPVLTPVSPENHDIPKPVKIGARTLSFKNPHLKKKAPLNGDKSDTLDNRTVL